VTAEQEPARPLFGWLNVFLGVVVVGLVVGLVLILSNGASGVGAASKDSNAGHDYDAVTKAASDETLAFMTVDYRNMDKLMAKVLDGSTGQFKQEYQHSGVQLKSAVSAEQSVSTGKVLSVGISTLDRDSAVVFVAADSQVKNKSTKGKTQPRFYRLQMDLAKVKGRWLVNKLQFVG
jgi:Mce-associated membrane protein